VDGSLEPKWVVFTDRTPEGIHIGAKDRERLAMSDIGGYMDRHLAWGKGSALQRLTGTLHGAHNVLNDALRGARDGFTGHDETDAWEVACIGINERAKRLGVSSTSPLAPGFDMRASTSNSGTLALFDGMIPTRLYGTGSRRLLTLSIQQQSTQDGTITLIDEIEHGLEPHRLRHLIKQLSLISEDEMGAAREGATGQAFITTHSSISIVECKARNLHVVRCISGVTRVFPVSDELQSFVRSSPEALLGRKVIVGEGKTETGLCRGLDCAWAEMGAQPFAYLGVVGADGGGNTKAPGVAMHFASLGYETALIVDSDAPILPGRAEVEQAGVHVIQWPGCRSTEDMICKDLPWADLQNLLDCVMDHPEFGEESVLSQVATKLVPNTRRQDLSRNINDWLSSDYAEDTIRVALGLAANKGRWFKRIDLGEHLGILVGRALPSMSNTELSLEIERLRVWIYA
jgi:putative ATP-dependent endonuclease of OLD family